MSRVEYKELFAEWRRLQRSIPYVYVGNNNRSQDDAYNYVLHFYTNINIMFKIKQN